MLAAQKPGALSILVATSLIGCSGDVATSNNGNAVGGATSGTPSASGGTAGQTSTSVGCISVSLTEAKVNVYGNGAALIVERTGAINVNYRWSPVATIAVPGGPVRTCAVSGTDPTSDRYAYLWCDGTIVSTACGTTGTVEVSLGANGFAPGNSSPVCETAAMTLTYTVPVKCANYSNCPGSSCDIPGSTCYYQTTQCCPGIGGSPTVSLPCTCGFNSTTGARAWSCFIS